MPLPVVQDYKDSTFLKVLLLICFFFTFAKIKTPFFDFYYYYFIIIAALPFFLIKYKTVPKNIILIFFILLLIGIANVLFGSDALDLLIKVWAGAIASYVFYYYIIKYYNFDLSRLFSIYIKGAVVVSFLGLFQVVAYQLQLKWGYDYSWLGLNGIRAYTGLDNGLMGLYPIHSIYGEPAHFGCGIAPASFVALNNIFTKKQYYISRTYSVIIILAMILTTATTAYFALFIGLLILIINSRGFGSFIFLISTSPLLFFYLYNNNNKFQGRIDSIIALFQDDSSLRVALLSSSGSVRIWADNFVVAYRNFFDHILFGTGLGSHAIAYFKYSLIPSWHEDYGMNYNDANSLFSRLLSETGLLGIVSLIAFLFLYNVKRTNKNTLYWLLNKSSLVIILTFLLRQGHYFSYALPLFILMYYYSSSKGNTGSLCD